MGAMRSTEITQLSSHKTENKLFVCSIHDLDEKAADLNKLFDEGWIEEDTVVVADRYVVLLKKQVEMRKVFYVDVGSLPPEEIVEYMDRVKQMAKEGTDGDYFIPIRGSR